MAGILSADEKNLIADWSNAVEADAERAEAEGYLVDLEARGVHGNAVARVVAHVDKASWSWARRADRGKAPASSVMLVTGFRGSGKTTMLRRAARELEKRGLSVLHADAASVHDLAHPVSTKEFLAILVALIANHPLGRGVWPAYKQRALNLLPLRLGEAQVGVNAGVASFALVFQRLQEDDGELEGAKKLLAELAGAVAAQVEKAGSELVFIVDSLEKFTGVPTQLREVIRSVESVFTRHPEALRLPNVHCIYTIPPVLPVWGPVPDVFGGAVTVMPSVKVADRKGAAFGEGIDALRELLAKRVDLGRAFASDEVVKRLVTVSGGHVQDLLNLVQGALSLQWAKGEPLPVTSETVEGHIAEVLERRRPLEAGATALLKRIDARRDLGELGPDDFERLIAVLDNFMVLAYLNTERWYAVHPLTQEAIAASEKRSLGSPG